MRVKAKNLVVYKDIEYARGDEFELDELDYEKYKDNVIVVKDLNPSLTRKRTK